VSSGRTPSSGSRPRFTPEEQQTYIEKLRADKLKLAADVKLLKEELNALRSGSKRRQVQQPALQQRDNRRHRGDGNRDRRRNQGKANLQEELDIFFADVPDAPHLNEFFSWFPSAITKVHPLQIFFVAVALCVPYFVDRASLDSWCSMFAEFSVAGSLGLSGLGWVYFQRPEFRRHVKMLSLVLWRCFSCVLLPLIRMFPSI